jgi:hypothetical protein
MIDKGSDKELKYRENPGTVDKGLTIDLLV